MENADPVPCLPLAAWLLTEAELEALRLAATVTLLAMTDSKPKTDADVVALAGAVSKIGRPNAAKPEKVKGWTGARVVPKSVK